MSSTCELHRLARSNPALARMRELCQFIIEMANDIDSLIFVKHIFATKSTIEDHLQKAKCAYVKSELEIVQKNFIISELEHDANIINNEIEKIYLIRDQNSIAFTKLENFKRIYTIEIPTASLHEQPNLISALEGEAFLFCQNLQVLYSRRRSENIQKQDYLSRMCNKYNKSGIYIY